jgi:hypothetical protein
MAVPLALSDDPNGLQARWPNSTLSTEGAPVQSRRAPCSQDLRRKDHGPFEVEALRAGRASARQTSRPGAVGEARSRGAVSTSLDAIARTLLLACSPKTAALCASHFSAYSAALAGGCVAGRPSPVTCGPPTTDRPPAPRPSCTDGPPGVRRVPVLNAVRWSASPTVPTPPVDAVVDTLCSLAGRPPNRSTPGDPPPRSGRLPSPWSGTPRPPGRTTRGGASAGPLLWSPG